MVSTSDTKVLGSVLRFPARIFVRTLFKAIQLIMDTKPTPDPKPRPLGNESPDPFSPAYPPGTLHEILRQEEDEEDVGGDATPAVDDPKTAKEEKKP